MVLALVRVLIAFVIACVAAGIAQVGFAVGWEALLDPVRDDRRILEWVLLTATHSAVFAGPFALIAASVGEWQSFRSAVYYGLAGIAIAMAGFVAQYQSELPGQASIANNYALVAFVVTGLVGGLTYWIFSGRYAGETPKGVSAASAAAPKTA